MGDFSDSLKEQVIQAVSDGVPLKVSGGGSKEFLGRHTRGRALHTSQHHGIVSYEPSELVITARTGTLLQEIEAILSEKKQMLACEAPHFGKQATLGGMIACGLSGPRRPFAGAVRDFVLGCRIINGNGEILTFGGQVMKNVAGYDVSRLMAGAMGTLGVLLEVSLRVLPQPATDVTVRLPCSLELALEQMTIRSGQSLPLSGSCFDGEFLYFRLSGPEPAVSEAVLILKGECIGSGADFWRRLNEQTLPFFSGDEALWRFSVAPASPPIDINGRWLYDWSGAQRWLKSDVSPSLAFQAAEKLGGHAMLYQGGNRESDIYHPLPRKLSELHRNLKKAFDPAGVLNPNRMYREW